MAAKMNDPNRVIRGTCPLTPTDAVNICAGNALVKLANVNEWTCKDSNETVVQASITVEDNGDVKLRIPFQALAPDYLALPNVACVGGSWIATSALIDAQDWDAITQNAAAAADMKS